MNWTDFHDPDFVPTFNPIFTDSELEDKARELCSDDTACLFDVAATGRLEIGSSALSAKEEQDVHHHHHYYTGELHLARRLLFREPSEGIKYSEI